MKKLDKKIHAQQSAPKPPYVGRMNVGRGDRGEGSPGRATRYYAGVNGAWKAPHSLSSQMNVLSL